MVLGFFHRRLMGFCCRISILNSTQKVRAILAATYTQYDFIREMSDFQYSGIVYLFLRFSKNTLISSPFFLKLLKI